VVAVSLALLNEGAMTLLMDFSSPSQWLVEDFYSFDEHN
jgi:hypothetical protein